MTDFEPAYADEDCIIFLRNPRRLDLTDDHNLQTWHGINLYGLRSAILRGLTNSVDEGGRHAHRGVGVYSSPCIEVASYYATPHNAFEDGRYWQTLLRLSMPRAKTEVARGTYGPEAIADESVVNIIGIMFMVTSVPTTAFAIDKRNRCPGCYPNFMRSLEL